MISFEPHPCIMAKSKKRSTTANVGLVSVALGIITVSGGQWRPGLMFLGAGMITLAVAYLSTSQRCGGYARSTPDGICANQRRGALLRGCGNHEWWRVKVFLGMQEHPAKLRQQQYQQRRSTSGGSAVGALLAQRPTQSISPESRRDQMVAWSTIVGGLTGVVSLLVGVVTLLIQLIA
jgi:hypothetical protein